MPLAYSYDRFSTARQADGLSVRRQTKIREEWLTNHPELGLVITAHYADHGLSGMTGANRVFGALGQFNRDVANGNIPVGSYLLVESLDRLTREELYRAMSMVLSILNAGIIIVCIADGFILNAEDDPAKTMFDIILCLMVLSRASNESLSKSNRAKGTWAIKRGDVTTRSKPYTKNCPAWITWSEIDNKFVLIEEHNDTVVRIFEMAAQGLGTALIVQNLIKENRKPMNFRMVEKVPTIGKWSRRYVSLILQSPAVYGDFETGTKNHSTRDKRLLSGQIHADYFPRAISAELWANAQAQISSRKILAPTRNRRGDFSNLLAGLCRCVSCGAAMTITHKGGTSPLSYLRCPDRYHTKTCTGGRQYRYQALEGVVLDSLSSLLLDPAETQSDMAALVDSIADLKRKIENTGASIKRIIKVLGDDDEDAAAQIAEFKTDRETFRKQLATLENERVVKSKPMPVADDLARLNALREALLSDDEDKRVAARAELSGALRSILTCVGFYPDGSVVLEVANGYRFIGLHNTLGRNAQFNHHWTISVDTATGLPRFGVMRQETSGERQAVGVVFEDHPQIFGEMFSESLAAISQLAGLGVGDPTKPAAMQTAKRRAKRRADAVIETA